MSSRAAAIQSIALVAASLCALAAAADAPRDAAATPRPVAVVELFTSEGCSSCPAADALLARLAADHEPKSDVIFLAFHVDYWDSLGWPDPFASEAATERQKDYVRALGLRSMYTPQMIVSGREEFVGSDEKHAAAAIRKALESQPSITPTVDAAAPRSGRRVRIHWSTDKPSPPGSETLVALVEDGLSTDVLRGENAGKTLPHERVVRAFTVVPGVGGNNHETDLLAPAGLDFAKTRAVVVVQDVGMRRTLGAASARLTLND